MVRSSDGSRLYTVSAASGWIVTTTAFDASGTIVWQTSFTPMIGQSRADAISALPPEIAVSPDGARVFVLGSDIHSMGYVTVAYDARSGVQQWSASYVPPGLASSGSPSPSGIVVSPDSQRVYVTGGAPQRPVCSQGSPFGACDNYATVAYSASNGAQLWASQYDDAIHGDDQATSLALSPLGDVLYVTGVSKNATIATEFDYVTVAYTTVAARGSSCSGDTCVPSTLRPGARLWTQRFLSGTHGIAGATNLGLSPDGSRVYVTGIESTDDTAYCEQVALPTYQFTTVAYAAAGGAQLWLQRYNGTSGGPNGWNFTEALTVDSHDRVYVTGQATGPGGSCDLRFSTLAYDGRTGRLHWSAQWSLAPLDESPNIAALSIAVSPDASRVYVAGWATAVYTCGRGQYRNPQGCAQDAITVAYRTSNGAQEWASRYNDIICNNQVPGEDNNQSVAVSPSGGTVYVGGNGCQGPQIMAFSSE